MGADSSEEMGISRSLPFFLLLPGVVPAYPTSRVSSGASLPPDGTTFRHLGLGEKQTRLIPAYSFWNFQVMHRLLINLRSQGQKRETHPLSLLQLT